MKKLATKIINFAKEHRACDEQLNPALAAYEAGDYETVLATARGNIGWLTCEGFKIPNELRNGRAVCWHDNGKMECEYNLINVKLEGIARRWYHDGQIWLESNYKDGERDGLTREWYENGQLACECTYRNDESDGLYIRWRDNGQLEWEETYKNGVLIQL